MTLRNSSWYASNNVWRRVGQIPITPGAPLTKPVIGAATLSDTSTSFSSLESSVGTLYIRRSYAASGSFPATYAASNAGIDSGVRESIWSFKPTPSDFAAGTNDSWFNSFLDSIPSGQKVIFMLWHEPENEINTSQFTLADWKLANNHMGSLVHAKGRPELRTAICLLGSWDFDPSSPYHTWDFWDSGFEDAIDYIGFDPYTSDGNFIDVSADTYFQNAMTWATTTHNKPVILPEFGAIDNVDATKKATWITNTYNYAVSHNIYSICYFDIDMDASHTYSLTTTESFTAFSNINASSKA